MMGGMQHYLRFPDVADALHSAISNKRPFSLIRLGDGEARIMGYPTDSSWLSVSEMLKVWFGHPFFPDMAIQQIQQDLKAACQSADILGIPNPAFVRDTDRNNPFKAATLFAREFGYLRDDAVLTSPGIHSALERNGVYDRLLGGLDEVVLITSREVASMVADRFAIRKVTPLLIPPEMQYSDLSPIEKLERTLLSPHFPTRYLEVGAFISDYVKSRPGIPVLVGAGILGKIYCCWTKSQGGIGIDIGSVFDAWAGLRTRGNPLFASARLVQDPTGRPPWLIASGTVPEVAPAVVPETGASARTSAAIPDSPGIADGGGAVLVFQGIACTESLAKPMQFRCRVDGALTDGFLSGAPIGVASLEPAWEPVMVSAVESTVKRPEAGLPPTACVRFRVAFAVDGDTWQAGRTVALEALDRRGDWIPADGSFPDAGETFASVLCVRHRVVRFAIPPLSKWHGKVEAVLRLPHRIPAGYRDDAALSPMPLEDATLSEDGSLRIRMDIHRDALRGGQAGFLLPASCTDGTRLEFPAAGAGVQ